MALLSNFLKFFGVGQEIIKQEVVPFDPSKFVMLPLQGRPLEIPGRIKPQQLRRLATIYWPARACINYRSTQITQLDWTIIPPEEKQEVPKELLNFFKHPESKNKRLRHFLDKVIEDLLTLDAVAIYKKENRGGGVIGLLPVDSATIRVRVLEDGTSPEPPDIAYEQILNSQIVAEMTQDELIYDMLNPRSYSPYGLAPLESLIIQATSALKVDTYNLSYLTEGNVPEGFIYLPPAVANSPDKIVQWQRWFDAFMSGDPRMMRKLKVMPGDSKYEATKKVTDMEFQKFQLWLLNACCAAFGVPPYCIGITEQVYKVAGEAQIQLGEDRGLVPLANFFKEIFDSLIEELGFEGFSWKWTSLDIKDRKMEAEIADKMIPLGAMNIDEWREVEGKEKLGVPNFVMTPQGPQALSDFFSVQTTISGMEAMSQELTKWKRKAMKDIEEKGRIYRPFYPDVLQPEITNRIQNLLKSANSKEKVWQTFSHFQEEIKRPQKKKEDYLQTIYEFYSDFEPEVKVKKEEGVEEMAKDLVNEIEEILKEK